jgi:hypothetical protein
MTHRRKLLLETLQGHIALLEHTHPRKAATRVARRVRHLCELSLRQRTTNSKRHAA